MITIRKAKINDFLSIAFLERAVWNQNEDLKFVADSEHAWRIWVEYALVYCAEVGGRIVGAGVAFPTVTNLYCFHKLFVLPHYRSKSIGSNLLLNLLEIIDRQKNSAFLTVEPNNIHAIALYNQYGFTDQVYVEDYYRVGEDRLVLTRHAKSETKFIKQDDNQN